MKRKQLGYIIMFLTLIFGICTNINAANTETEVTVSNIKTNYCEYNYNGLKIKLYETADGKLEKSTEGSLTSYDDFNIEYLKDENFIKQRSCPKLYTYLYTMAPAAGVIDSTEKKILYFFFNQSDSFAVLNTTVEYLENLQGTSKRIITTCLYKAYGVTYTVKWNPNTKVIDTSHTIDTSAAKYDEVKIQKNAKKNFKYNDNGLNCNSNNIVFDKCQGNRSYVQTFIQIRTKEDNMCSKALESTSVGSKKEDETEIFDLTSLCSDKNVKTVMKLIGYLLVIIKIIIPILLIGLGTKSLVQTVISGKQEDLKKSALGLMWKFIAAVVIFVLPTIINFIVGLINGATDGISDYYTCRTCIFEPGKC